MLFVNYFLFCFDEFSLFHSKKRVKVQVIFEMQNYFYNKLSLFSLNLANILAI